MILQVGLPVTSREPFDPKMLFDVFATSFAATVSGNTDCKIYLGIDRDDDYYRTRVSETRHKLAEITRAEVFPVTLVGLKGRICEIWQRLAMEGYHAGADCFLFAGDDLKFLTKNWDKKLCKPLAARGYGIESFFDVAFPDFPTFPIFHRSHIDCFNRVFPESFNNANQYGDPFLFQIYQRIGAANLQRETRCHNTIGGSGAARYSKIQPSDVPINEWAEKLRSFVDKLPSVTVPVGLTL